MREGICKLIKRVWDGKEPLYLTRNLVKDFIKISMIDQREAKFLGVRLYFSALETEYKQYNSFKGIEGQSIEAFSTTINKSNHSINKTPSSIIVEMEMENSSSSLCNSSPNHLSTSLHLSHFFTTLEKLLEKESGKAADFADSARKFLIDMKELCEHLLALNVSQFNSDQNNSDDRLIATLSLMEYLKESNRINTYVRYVHSLAKQQVISKCYLKAGLVLMLHSNLLQWKLNSKPDFQSEFEFDSKISLYEEAIDLFERGDGWEIASDLVLELHQKYQNVLFDYHKAALCMDRQSLLYRKVLFLSFNILFSSY